MSKAKFVFVSLAVLSLASLGACSKKETAKGQQGPAPVGYVVVHTQQVQVTQDLAGRTSAFLVADVRPQVSGIIKARLFTEGGAVSAGQSLYQIDPATYQAAYDSALAAEQQAQAGYDLAHTNAARAQQLITIKAISQSDFDSAQAAEKQAAATLAVQKATVETARINLNYTKVLSPISGRIGKSSVTPGALVTANQTTALATVQDLSKMYVDITQSTADLLKLKRAIATGQLSAPDHADVTLTLDDGTNYNQTGRIEFSDVTVDPATGSVTLRALFPNPNGVLLPGMFVRAHLVNGAVPNGILIPQGAVILDPKGGATVLIAGDDGKAQSRKVTLGQMQGSQWQVTSGLSEGDKVITEGAMRLKAGAAIKAEPAKAAPPSSAAASAE
jgi:membrane fusion protein (multidrug efflux system)